MSRQLTITSGQYSVAGIKAENEDACGILTPEGSALNTKGISIVIADGMSGCEAGREASEACVSGFFNDYYSTPESWTVKSSVQKVLSALNRWLYGNGQREYNSAKGMVTTFSALVLKSNTGYLFHVGDTRVYRLRNNDLERLTTDHRIQIANDRSYLSRAMGIEPHIDIDFRTINLEQGDQFLLLSDGVHEFIDDATLKRMLIEGGRELQTTCEAIVKHAEQQQSDDNLTCQLVSVESLPNQNEQEFYRSLTELPFPPSLSAGMRIDGYRVLRELFSSKRTEVFLVEDEESGERLVLKAPSVNYNDDPDYINQFLHEEWAGRRLNSDHVLKVVDQPRQRHFLYYLTEHIEGQTLRQWMNDNPRPHLQRVREIVHQLVNGLRAFHRLEMIHQDLKPENILIDGHGTVKIIDLGSTKIAGIEEIATPLDDDNLLGTVNYTAPEYHRGDIATSRSDLFSLGVITYEMLTGKLPYDRELNARNLMQVRYVPGKRHFPELPFWMDKALERAVRLDATRRYDILSEFEHDLSHPNPAYIKEAQQPLIERNPLGFWRGLAIALLLINMLLVALLVTE
ncbi:protein kinase [Solemya pervernicosa gill symbiont]|uniref:Protein kinase n=2 Tax=Gammaproteobacteria incertae sedis TaxID=118884 RepID=A0A1T2L3B8_9GAMM|nr:bifunctional protein-serine/threonine kinase/phosphatase [Candidatus Reidiella endopervernicosa]OOZ39593.1 protein kinase [Solemya pervernicosa gill symbiont]QKQ27849.1 bifunctional protein-serine/threonine kinase/phosphatase [Candidatus Reidiella endopervernicosa]